jgi:hypothetical protein
MILASGDNLQEHSRDTGVRPVRGAFGLQFLLILRFESHARAGGAGGPCHGESHSFRMLRKVGV